MFASGYTDRSARSRQPEVVDQRRRPAVRATRDSADARCFCSQPYTMLSPATLRSVEGHWISNSTRATLLRLIAATFRDSRYARDLPAELAFKSHIAGMCRPIGARSAAGLLTLGSAASAAWRSIRVRCGRRRRHHPGQRPADADRDCRISSAARPADTETAQRRFADHHRQSQAQRPVRADRSGGLHREDRQRRCGAALSRLAHHQCAGARRPGAMTRQADGRLKAEFRLWDVFAGQQLAGQQYFTTPDNWRRIAHIISDAIYERLTGEKGYFDSRVVFIDETGPEGAPHQAARHHGSGRRQRALSHARRRSRADAALLAVDPGDHLYVLRPGRSARLSAQHRDRPARDRRQFSRHELRAALFAGRTARDHEPAGGHATPTFSSWICARRR